jgi:riboflavin kinase/FMN adenylyltransferase
VIVLDGPVSSWTSALGACSVAVGVFDGVHVGHRAVFEAQQEIAPDLPRAVLTFSVHPASVLAASGPPPMLTTMDRKLELLEGAGVDAVALIGFDDDVRHIEADDFVRRYLVDGLHAGAVAVGDDFRFGHEAGGTVTTLLTLGSAHGFSVAAVPEVELDGVPVRSTIIRSRLANGEVAEAAALLGRPHDVDGVVVEGDGRGRAIGVPTANLTIPSGLALPGRGVYGVHVAHAGRRLPGVANLGVRPTFHGEEEILEVHLLDVDLDLYGEALRVEFAFRIREERRFESVDALIEQIHDDIGGARPRLAEVG